MQSSLGYHPVWEPSPAGWELGILMHSVMVVLAENVGQAGVALAADNWMALFGALVFEQEEMA